MADFKASVLAKNAVELPKDAEVRENMEVTTVDKAAWKDVKAVKSSAVISAAVTGNVVGSRALWLELAERPELLDDLREDCPGQRL